VKGAFTGALKEKKGRFELAQKGSIFLDEVGDISLATQVKLLRVLQEKQFERVGGEETITADVRIIAATNKELQHEIKQGNFREDLYYRLHVIPIFLPPLRERMEDIPLLTGHFIEKIGREMNMSGLGIEEAAVENLRMYSWPGNIRELENVIERAAVLCNDNLITPADLLIYQSATGEATAAMSTEMDLNGTLEQVEKDLLEKAMAKAHGNKTEAARALGIKTSALYYKLEKYGLL
jgi:two-component system response regulator HydG